MAARVLAPAEAEAWLGDLQLRIQRTGDAARRIESAAAAAPDNAAAQLVLARLRLAQDRADEAWPALEAALRLAPEDFAIQYRAGVTALQYLDRATGARQVDAGAAGARRVDQGRSVRAEFSGHLRAGWRTRACANGHGTKRRRAISRAIGLAPGRTEFRLRQADIMILRGSPERGPADADGDRRALGRQALSRQRAAASRGARRGGVRHAGAQGSRSVARLLASARSAARSGWRTARVRPADRRGVRRRRPRALSCRGRRPRSRDGGRAASRTSTSCGTRTARTSTLGCGGRVPPDPVYVTWRADKPADWPGELAGVTVAVEFLPLDFVP